MRDSEEQLQSFVFCLLWGGGGEALFSAKLPPGFGTLGGILIGTFGGILDPFSSAFAPNSWFFFFCLIAKF